MKLAVHLVLTLFAWANAAALVAASEGELDAIRQCAESYVAAYNQGDAEALAALWVSSRRGNNTAARTPMMLMTI